MNYSQLKDQEKTSEKIMKQSVIYQTDNSKILVVIRLTELGEKIDVNKVNFS